MDKDREPARAAAEGSLAERKARLLRQGDFYRAGIVQAKHHIKQGARPENIFHTVVDHAVFALRSRVDGLLRPSGISVGTLMPYAMTALSFINRRRLQKPALGLAVLGALAAWYVHRRRAAHV
ncbi:hypothetical protein [Massilia cavernae]|uniref:Uncharacterized protein n=1 Tax=Massilia cavernae TaxID=2320864 RepID=A0A418Y4F8_9BURK|nr:hypothetical protein [Massilia cavernae]RJG20482.1 hypothetical protein D3872_08445 [Massilia cavernae]